LRIQWGLIAERLEENNIDLYWAYRELDELDVKIAVLQNQLRRLKRGSVIGFTVGGITFGIGVPLMIEGIRSDNRTMVWAGVGVFIDFLLDIAH
jgi:Ca2+/H+ antiporter